MEGELKLNLVDEDATVAAGEALGRACLAAGMHSGLTLFLHGQLGAGKTTFCRGVLRAFGHRGAVKSPTYTLVEPYDLGEQRVYHFDLYRLGDAEELEFMGVRDYFAPHSLSLVEWSERGAGVLPEPDLELELEVLDRGRQLQLVAHSRPGAAVLDALYKLL
ncbi:tRNA threonylcarbamoyladenosine biosynthesis protein TsaE [Microbulbifer donghaiensis]|uniref:tRNA threonylcarbamoyladenosine biosynthesis protein TsaE n=1 Tax=Microbulbifer donghaiensis TaxID=494016 RepID=A0A1M5EI97_9GAMM|nr:tRNA (adenosine(37)-N6)-threonylcarbamoyltransferase complex ATPase subunit type 1 TsaE [Microbulbifer donghaiensis]SHF78844.1 tRNA threonylcarbamoyladenosine biosynthesis protein TsaE [Microbulbifer donghaiensis]